MSKPFPARCCTTNWSDDNAALCRRGSLLVWLDPEMEGLAPKRGRPERPRTFSDAAIQFCLGFKVLFGLALGRTIGMAGSLLRMAGLEDWPVPDFSTLCRRQRTVTIQIPCRCASGPLNLLVDSTGVKRLGKGEWQVRKHAPGRRRQGRKVHLVMDAGTGDIRGVEVTSSQTGDSPVLPDLWAPIPRIGSWPSSLPIRKNGRPRKEDGPAARARNETLRTTRHSGRALWKRPAGYHARSRIETRMRRRKSFGKRIAARDPDHQAAEIHARIALMTRLEALERAQITRVA